MNTHTHLKQDIDYRIECYKKTEIVCHPTQDHSKNEKEEFKK